LSGQYLQTVLKGFCDCLARGFSLDITVSDSVPVNLMCGDDDEEVVSTNNIKNVCPEVLHVKANERMGRACGGKMPEEFFCGNSLEKKIGCSVVELHPVDKGQGKMVNSKPKKSSSSMSEICSKMANVMLTKYEREGLRAIVKWLESLPANKKGLPKDIPDPDLLLRDTRVSYLCCFCCYGSVESFLCCLLFQ
jgi:hypothetical protein